MSAAAPSASRDVRAPPGNRRGRYVENGEYIAAARRMVRAAGRRVGDMDLEELPALAALAAEADAVLAAAALRLHDECGYPWSEIGRVLGHPPASARQAAYQRFGRGRAGVRDGSDGEGNGRGPGPG